MTRDEVLKMGAGREMDALIAEKIFEWKWIDLKDMFGHPVHTLQKFGYLFSETNRCYPNQHNRDLGSVAYFSTDIDAAWEVFTNKLFVHFSVDRTDDRGETYYASCSNTGAWNAFANTAPLAICHVALLAVMEKE